MILLIKLKINMIKFQKKINEKGNNNNINNLNKIKNFIEDIIKLLPFLIK